MRLARNLLQYAMNWKRVPERKAVYVGDPAGKKHLAAAGIVVGSYNDGSLATTTGINAVFSQLAPWQFEGTAGNLRRTHRRASVLLSRVLGNLGVRSSTPLLDRFQHPPASAPPEQRWRTGFYLDDPQEWDDPYRFFRW